MRIVLSALLALAMGAAGAAPSSGLVLGNYRHSSAPVLVAQGSCYGNCAAQQGQCIAACGGNGQCIGNCAARHGICVSGCN